MFYLKLRCPHCRETSEFPVFGISEYDSNIEAVKAHNQRQNSFRPMPIQHASMCVAGLCANCNQPALVKLKHDAHYLHEIREHLKAPEKRYTGPKPEILKIWPEPAVHYSHPSLPDQIKKPFLDLQRMIDEQLTPPFIVIGCRAVLEEAIKVLGGEGKSLVQKIDDLKDKAIISGVLAEWAREVRISGNEAAHELKATSQEAVELVEYTKMFLQYAFEFPARIEEKRRKKNAVQ